MHCYKAHCEFLLLQIQQHPVFLLPTLIHGLTILTSDKALFNRIQ